MMVMMMIIMMLMLTLKMNKGSRTLKMTQNLGVFRAPVCQMLTVTRAVDGDAAVAEAVDDGGPTFAVSTEGTGGWNGRSVP